MKFDKQLPDIVRNISGKYFLNFYFLNVDISLIMHDLHLKLYICTDNIAVEGKVSQIFDKGPCSFSIKFRKIYSKIYIKRYPFFFFA